MNEFQLKDYIDKAANQRERAERAEAECERLTRWIKWYLDQFDEQDWTTEDQMLLEAVREGAPPPEGEPENDGCELCGRSPDEIADAGCCQIAPHTPEQTELKPCPFCGSTDIDPSFVFQSDDEGESYGPGCECCAATAASVGLWNSRSLSAARETISRCESEQTGDALALFDEYVERGHLFWNTYKRQDAIAKIRQALTASGVPESVRELPAEWENGTEGMTDSAAAAYRCCARALRFALASAPADGWKLVPVQMTPEMRKAFWQAHDEYECPEDYGKQVGPEAPQHQWDAVLAAAPTDGRED